jgi:prepilin signal peptidase PulO-like enzyme (type II secretory pathway)
MQLILGIALFLLGTVLASFLGVITERIHTGQSWFQGRSRCNSCRRTLTFLDLVPVFSWIFSQGRCRTCRAKIPFTYAASELVLGTFFVVSYLSLGLSLALLFFLLALLPLTFVVLYDLRHTIVPWTGSLLLLLLSLVFAGTQINTEQEAKMTLLVAVLIGCFFLLMFFLSQGRAMGLGDAPIAFSLSILVGSAAVSGLLFSFWIGAIVGIAILLFRRGGPKMGIEIPFVPFLAIGYVLAFFVHWNPFL